MPAPDYENDLVFPPQPVFLQSRKNLTDDWKAGRLLCENYWVKLINDDVIVSFFDGLEFSCCKDFGIKEVLAPCDYNHIVELTEKVKAQKEELERLKEENIKHLRYIGGLIDEGSNLLNLLKDCQKYLHPNIESDRVMDCEGTDLLIRINAAIGEEEE